MNYKVSTAILVVLIVAVGFLAYQNNKLNSKIEELAGAKTDTNTASQVKPADAEPSPFDNPNHDPLAGRSDSRPAPTTVKFEKTVHDFGRINEGDVVNTVFKFTNTGNSPLLITDAQGSCGCTVPSWPRDPIPAGESGEINVRFDSKGKKGENEKTVTVATNTIPASMVLTVKSTIVPKDK